MENIPTRQNNPGDIRDSTTGAYNTYGSPQEGFNALTNDLDVKISGRSKTGIKPTSTLADFAKVWAPDSDGNNSAKYASDLASQLGVTVDTPISKLSNRKQDLAMAIAKNEGYHGPQVAGMEANTPQASTITDTNTTASPISGKMSVSDFAAKIKQQYPQYQSTDDQTLVSKIIAKYPVYADKVDTSQISPSSTDTTTDTTQQDQATSGLLGTNPADDAYGKILNNSITRGIQALFPGKEVGQSIGTLAGYGINAIKEKLGLAPKGSTEAYDISAPTPLQTTADIAQGALTVGGIPAIGEAGSTLARVGIAGTEGAALAGTGAIAQGKPLAEVGKDTVIGGGLGLAGGALGEGVATGYKGLSKIINGKTAEEILNTAESDVSKLTPNQQKLWYKNQADTARFTATKATESATQAGEDATSQIKQEITDLNQKIGQGTRETAISLKQPAQKVMRDASDNYLELSGEAADGSKALDKTMTHEDLSAQIDKKFNTPQTKDYDPSIAASLKKELGLREPEERLDEEGNPIIEAGVPKLPEITNQEILDKAREIMQSVSKTARQGNKVYSPAEYQAMQKYSFLMDSIGDNGVDMTAANKFWKEYAPLRDRIVREIKPFEETNTGKMPFTSTLNVAESAANTSRQMASKLDAQNFISQLEDKMNLPKGTIGSDVREQVQKLEKAKLSKDTIKKVTDEAVAKIKADKVEALKNMSLKQYDTERIARVRKVVKNIIYGTLGISVLGGGTKHIVAAML